MFNKITPEKAGIKSKYVEKFLRTLEGRGLAMHSVLLMRGEDIFAEYYWVPFDRDFCHRMYSETKSYVSIAIGLLEEDGLIDLDMPIHKYFPEKTDRELPLYLKEQTVKQMLTMQTTGGLREKWFSNPDPDRTHLYFAEAVSDVPAGMRWKYDSAASQVLSALVEKKSGMALFDFLYKRIFSKLGTFNTATILKTKTEDSWGDSALLCTTRDMASFARFCMNYGKWKGEQLLNEEYLRTATSRIADNDVMGFDDVLNRGYGYQIWRSARNGFAFNGMGAQFTVCIPDKDLIFVCTSDNQGYPSAKSLILTAFYEIIADNISDSELTPDNKAYESCEEYGKTLKLQVLSGDISSPFSGEIDGVKYICEQNETGITEFCFKFDSEDRGRLLYKNEQGEKELAFGLGKNIFTKFPQFGYSDLHGGLSGGDGFMYDCAVSAAWREEQKLYLKVQIIDKYFGNMFARFSFNGERASVTMIKNAEAFLEEYQGTFNAKRA